MLSPSLVSAIAHCLWRDNLLDRRSYEDPRRLLRELRSLTGPSDDALIPRVPLVGRSKRSTKRHLQEFGADIQTWNSGDGDNNGNYFFWGRVRADILLDYALEWHSVSPEEEYLDFGAPLAASAAATTHGLCEQLIAQTAISPEICIGIIDSGIAASGVSPEDFGGFLHHVERTDIQMSAHAKATLAVLLERLAHHQILHRTKLFCALTRPPQNKIGLKCFEHDASPELLTAASKLQNALDSEGLPSIVNISLGTHVGPHDGSSPLEDCLGSWASRGRNFVFCSAGNEGTRGIYVLRSVQAHVPEFINLTLGSDGCGEILLELWWPHTESSTLTAEVDVTLGSGTIRKPFAPLRIDSSTYASFPNIIGVTGMTRSSLFQARCSRTMNCMAFLLRTSNHGDLASAEIDIQLTSDSDVLVNGWIAAGGGGQATFIGGGTGGTVGLPGTSVHVISVAGSRQGKAWRNSSYGPASVYNVGPWVVARKAPVIAHDVAACSQGSGEGTSYSSPRAAADAARVLLDPKLASRCVSAADLVRELLYPRVIASWNPRIGYGIL